MLHYYYDILELAELKPKHCNHKNTAAVQKAKPGASLLNCPWSNKNQNQVDIELLAFKSFPTYTVVSIAYTGPITAICSKQPLRAVTSTLQDYGSIQFIVGC